MSTFKTDQALWYNNGIWGQLGYAVPNFGDDSSTLNAGIHRLTETIGRNLSSIMHHPDVDLRVPPSINTLTRVHRLVMRGRTILGSRAVPSGTPNMEAVHTAPARQVTLIFPVPYFRVRNSWLKEWCGLVLNALSEAMQHTENRKPYEISENFAGTVGQYFHRLYRLMAIELFGVNKDDAKALDFLLTDADLSAYDPAKYFTSTEMIDTVPPLGDVPTEDDLQVLTNGIPATRLVNLTKYPSGELLHPNGSQGTTAPAPGAVPAFSPPPGS